MSELSFLLDLLLEHKLPKTARDAVRARIKEVEAGAQMTQMVVPRNANITPAAFANQAPSMQAIMARNPDLVGPQIIPGTYQPPEPAPVAVIAQNQATAQAMASRAEAIAAAQAGKPDASGRKRKF